MHARRLQGWILIGILMMLVAAIGLTAWQAGSAVVFAQDPPTREAAPTRESPPQARETPQPEATNAPEQKDDDDDEVATATLIPAETPTPIPVPATLPESGGDAAGGTMLWLILGAMILFGGGWFVRSGLKQSK